MTQTTPQNFNEYDLCCSATTIFIKLEASQQVKFNSLLSMGIKLVKRTGYAPDDIEVYETPENVMNKILIEFSEHISDKDKEFNDDDFTLLYFKLSKFIMQKTDFFSKIFEQEL